MALHSFAATSSLSHLVAIGGHSAASLLVMEAAILDGSAAWFRFPANGRCVTLHVDQWDGFALLSAVTDARQVLACVAFSGPEELRDALYAVAAVAVPHLEG